MRYLQRRRRALKHALKPKTTRAVQKLAAKFEAWALQNEQRLLAVVDELGNSIAEKNADGRLVLWPKHGLNEHILGRFMWHYHDTHRGILRYPRPCLGTMRTTERNLHICALKIGRTVPLPLVALRRRSVLHGGVADQDDSRTPWQRS